MTDDERKSAEPRRPKAYAVSPLGPRLGETARDTLRSLRGGLRIVHDDIMTHAPRRPVAGGDHAPLRESMREIAKAVDGALLRTERFAAGLASPDRASSMPFMSPELLAAVLAGRGSEHLASRFLRALRIWLQEALKQDGENHALILERSLRHHWSRAAEAGLEQPGGATHCAWFLLAVMSDPPFRPLPRRGHDDAALWSKGFAAVLVTILFVSRRHGKMSVDPRPIIASARALLAADSAYEQALKARDRAALANRFQDLSAML